MAVPSERASAKQATTTLLLNEFKRLFKSETLLRRCPCAETALDWLVSVKWAANDIFLWMADDLGHQARTHADATVAGILGAVEWHFVNDGFLDVECRLARLCTQARKYNVAVQTIDFDLPGDNAHRHFAFATAYETVSRTLNHLIGYWSLLAFQKFGVERVLTPKASCGHIGLDIGVSVAAHSYGMIPAIRESLPGMNWSIAAAERLLVQFDEEIRQVEGFLWNLPPESQSNLFSKLFPCNGDAEEKPADRRSEVKPVAAPTGERTPVDDKVGRTVLVPSLGEFRQLREFAHGLSGDEAKAFALLLKRLDDASNSNGLPLRASEADIKAVIHIEGNWKFNTAGEWQGLQTRLTRKLKAASINWRVSSRGGAHLCRVVPKPKQPQRKALEKRARTPR